MATLKVQLTEREMMNLQHWREKLDKTNRAIVREALGLYFNQQQHKELIEADIVLTTKKQRPHRKKR